MSYPKERKESVLKKMLPPQSKSLRVLATEEGISEATVYGWRKAARAIGRLMPDRGPPTSRVDVSRPVCRCGRKHRHE